MKIKKESKTRQWLQQFKLKGHLSFIRFFYMYYFNDVLIDKDFLREVVEQLNDKQRMSFEDNILYDWNEEIPVGDAFVDNFNTYIENGLVKIRKEEMKKMLESMR